MVWKGVRGAQKMLKDNLKAEVQSAASPTSLQLTLEHKKLLEATQVYVKKLKGSLDKQTDVIGFAVAINGKVNNADVYASAAVPQAVAETARVQHCRGRRPEEGKARGRSGQARSGDGVPGRRGERKEDREEA